MFKDKVVLITGGSSRIGAETARLFAQNGAIVVLTYKINKKGAETVLSDVIKSGSSGLIIKADLTKDKEVKNVVEKTLKKFKRIDILVNNAGRYINSDEWNGPAKVWIKSLEQNLVSAMSMSKYVTKYFFKQKFGIIVNVASRYSVDGKFDSIAYSAAKAGIVNITQAYAKLLVPFGRANAVSPHATRAGYWLTSPKEELALKENKLIEPIVVAKKILYLASNETKDITGQNFLVGE